MRGCNIDVLVRLLDRKLNLDEKLEVFDHLDRCEICREAIYVITRDRDRGLFVYPPSVLDESSAA